MHKPEVSLSSLMMYRRVDGHSGRLVKDHEAVVLENYRYAQLGIRLKETRVVQVQHYHIALVDHVYAPHEPAAARYSALLPFKLRQHSL